MAEIQENINLSGTTLLTGGAAAGATVINLGVVPSDGALVSAVVSSSADDSGVTYTLEVNGTLVPGTSTTGGGANTAVTLSPTGGATTVSAGDRVTVTASTSVGETGATATLN